MSGYGLWQRDLRHAASNAHLRRCGRLWQRAAVVGIGMVAGDMTWRRTERVAA